MSNDPWANVPEIPKITAHQIHQVVGLIADYTEPEAAELIRTLTPRTTGPCCTRFGVSQIHASTCPTQGRD